jgi:hypothetical protein
MWAYGAYGAYVGVCGVCVRGRIDLEKMHADLADTPTHQSWVHDQVPQESSGIRKRKKKE